MAIATFNSYYPYMTLPVYMRLEYSDHHNREVGSMYEITVEDEDRAGEGPYNGVHEAELVAEREMRWREVSSLLLAYQGFARSKEKAIERICPNGEEPEGDRKVTLLVFLRADKVKESVAGEADVIPGDFQKEDTEAN